jgi:hypothetical protein
VQNSHRHAVTHLRRHTILTQEPEQKGFSAYVASRELTSLGLREGVA